ncbi:dolichol kinase [Aricia agestis]|uniref:dolichol kinase n=1 Tax=Aricia agestis TaxID=91739 RepID=UPI001C207AE6|nr:dolichol kinase [Aricia agestis]XP_041981071.1 dolichol kinase [Aricia agestis]
MGEIISSFISSCNNTLNKQITTSLTQANIETRPAKSHGITCLILLPAILVLYSCLDDVSLVYKKATCISLGLLLYSLLFILQLSVSDAVLKKTSHSGVIVSSMLPSALLSIWLQQDFRFCVCVSLLSTLIFSLLLKVSLVKFQKTFTIGEAIVVNQAITLFSVVSIIKCTFNINKDDGEMEFINTVIYIVLTTVCVMMMLLYFLPEKKRNVLSFVYIVMFSATFALTLLHWFLGPYCLINLLKYILIENYRWKILSFWLTIVTCTVLALVVRTKMGAKADTVTRKTFHILTSLIFVSGILFDYNLMLLAAGVGLGAIVLIEALRKARIEPFSSVLQSAFIVYSDEKDCGCFAMTPIYLYCGLGAPLALLQQYRPLEALAGVLSAGVGDTAASWAGSRYGRHHWSDSKKTLEGTVANILSQVAVVYILQVLGMLTTQYALARTLVAATVSALVEARTDQVDNLILPLVTLIALQCTRFIC